MSVTSKLNDYNDVLFHACHVSFLEKRVIFRMSRRVSRETNLQGPQEPKAKGNECAWTLPSPTYQLINRCTFYIKLCSNL